MLISKWLNQQSSPCLVGVTCSRREISPTGYAAEVFRVNWQNITWQKGSARHISLWQKGLQTSNEQNKTVFELFMMRRVRSCGQIPQNLNRVLVNVNGSTLRTWQKKFKTSRVLFRRFWLLQWSYRHPKTPGPDFEPKILKLRLHGSSPAIRLPFLDYALGKHKPSFCTISTCTAGYEITSLDHRLQDFS